MIIRSPQHHDPSGLVEIGGSQANKLLAHDVVDGHLDIPGDGKIILYSRNRIEGIGIVADFAV